MGLLPWIRRLMKCGADPLTEKVYGMEFPLLGVIPELPAIAGRRPLDAGPHLMDGAPVIGADDGSIGPHLGRMALAFVAQNIAGAQKPVLHQPAEGNARLIALGWGFQQAFIGRLRIVG